MTQTKYRTWCNDCKDFTIQSEIENNKTQVSCSCGKTNTWNYNINDVPEHKLKEQQERFKQHERQNNIYTSFLNGKGLNHIFNDDFKGVQIIEHDAGIKKQRQLKREEREAFLEEQHTIIATFSNINRNDKCKCGSGVKFKKCCKTKYDNAIAEIHL